MKLKNHVLAVKQALVKDIEGLTLRKAPMTDKVMAMLGLTVEAGTILVLMFPAGMPLALGAAALPLLINVAAAWFHSTYYEIPEAYAELLSRYEDICLRIAYRPRRRWRLCDSMLLSPTSPQPMGILAFAVWAKPRDGRRWCLPKSAWLTWRSTASRR